MNAEEALVALVTAPAASATDLARSLVDQRAAACVNVLPGAVSVYRWNDAMHEDPEVLLVVKTTRARFPKLERAILELHPYDCPEILALPVAEGHAAYLDWLGREVA
ncbi:MAG: divalent-cation tolerance protein CutA [Myxococcota bacterium]